HGLTDTSRHELRIARTGLRDALERDDHADDRTDEAEQRAGRDAEAQERLEALEPRYFAQHGFRDSELGDIRVLFDPALVALEGEQNATKRVVRRRVVEVLELLADARTSDQQGHELEEERQHAEQTDDDDDVADRFAELDT